MVQVRFAPSPTGSLHVGNCRTAILNWIYAKKMNGRFLLRIEDTDVERSTKESEEGIYDDMKWLGLNWDEGPEVEGEYGPYRQSERISIYKSEAEKLLREGKAYRCFCTQEELEREKEEQLKKGHPPKYSRKCMKLTEKEISKLISMGKEYSIRFHVQECDIEVNDLVMGNIHFKSDVISDFIILRSNGIAPYNFAVVVDDILMEITNVIRGGDHLSNTPKQILLYKAMNKNIPLFAHIPMITNIEGHRLSKRDGAVSVKEYRNMGILPETLINFLSLLSWSSPSGEEILSIEKLIEEFSFDRVSKSPAVFDIKKLFWMNNQYIKKLDKNRKSEYSLPYFPKEYTSNVVDTVDCIIGDLEYFAQIPEKAEIFFTKKVEFKNSVDISLLNNEEPKKILTLVFDEIESMDNFSEEELTNHLKKIIKSSGIKTKDFIHILRLVLTGIDHGPEIVKIMKIFGKEKCKKFIKDVLLIDR